MKRNSSVKSLGRPSAPFRPLGNRVLVKRDEPTTRTKKGIYLPGNIAPMAPREGVVMAVGEGRLTLNGDELELRVCVGDRVLFAADAGVDVGEELLLIDEGQLLAVVNE